jgi:hypothetical protein
MTPLVHDVDTTLFSGSNLGNRPGNIVQGQQYTFVVGTRTSGTASSRLLYSRALQNNTVHYYQWTCNGTNGSVGQFVTQNPPLGNTYSEPMPFNSSGFGNQAWPSINWTDRTVGYVDPLRGYLIKRVTGPGDNGGVSRGYAITSDGSGSFNYYNDINSAWTNPANVLAGSQSTYATYSGSSSDPLFVSWDTTGLPEGFFQWQLNQNGSGQPTLDNVQLALFGTGTDATSANRQIEVCLVFYDSHTCNTNYYTITLPTSAPSPATLASGVQPSSTYFPDGGGWAGWNITPLKDDVSVYSGSYTASGTLITINTDGNINWKAGAEMYMSGSGCPSSVCTLAAAPTSATTFTITQNIGTASGSFRSYAAGVLIKKITGTGSVNVSISSAYTESQQIPNPNDGNQQECSPNAIATGSGNAFFCSFQVTGNPGLWLFNTTTGNTTFIDPLYFDNSGTAASSTDYTIPNVVTTHWGPGLFDISNPKTFYMWFTYNNQHPSVGSGYTGQAANSIMTMTYSGSCSYTAYGHSLYPPNTYRSGMNTGVSPSVGTGWPDTCISYNSTNYAISNNTWLDYRIVNGASNWTNSMQSNSNIGVGVPRIAYGKAYIQSGPGGGNTGSGLWVMDVPTGSLQFSGSTFASTAYARWTVAHTTNVVSQPNTFNLQGNEPYGNTSNGFPSFGSYMRGPFRFSPASMYKSGSFSSDTSLPASTFTQGAVTGTAISACPSGLATTLVQQGATGTNCITFKSQMACSAAPLWYWTGYPNPTTTIASTVASGVTTVPFSAFANPSAITAGSYVYVSNFNVAGGPTGEAAFSSYYPGFELIYINSVNSGASTFTVTRSVNNVTGALPVYSNAAYPNPFNGQTPSSNGSYVGAVYVMTGSQSPEARDYPCEWGPTDLAGKAIYSEPSPMQAGDTFKAWGQTNQYGEFGKWQIVSVTSLGSANYQFVASWVPTSEINTYATSGTATNAWPSGWNGYMVSIDDTFFLNTTNLSAGWYPQFVGGGHSAYGAFAGQVYPTVVQASCGSAYQYGVWYHVPLMSLTNPFQPTTSIYYTPSYLAFSQSPITSYNCQSYPSQQQFSMTDNNNGRWISDFHTLLPPGGTASGVQTGLNGSSCGSGTLVGGTNTVWKWTGCPSGFYKYGGLYAFAGRYIFQDVSSTTTGNIITDSTPWQVCYTYNAGECQVGSSVGDIYMSTPQAGGQQTPYLGVCIVGGVQENLPCVIDVRYDAGAIVQGAIDQANTTNNWRVLTNGFAAPGQHWTYAAGLPTPDGTWMFFNCFYCSGVRTDVYAIYLSPFPSGAPANANDFAYVPVTLGAASQFNQARIRFGYAENGTPSTSTLYCTSRADGCVVSTSYTPFAFLSESNGYVSCSSGCSFSIPAIPGRMLYYVIDRYNSTSGRKASSPLQVLANP